MTEQSNKTPIEDLVKDALEHYDKVSSDAMHYMSIIPKALKFYQDHYHESDREENVKAIYSMLHEFRNWNAEWNKFMKTKPSNADDFVVHLSTKYTVRKK